MHSQQFSTNGTSREPFVSSPHHHNLFFSTFTLLLHSHLRLGLPRTSSPSDHYGIYLKKI